MLYPRTLSNKVRLSPTVIINLYFHLSTDFFAFSTLKYSQFIRIPLLCVLICRNLLSGYFQHKSMTVFFCPKRKKSLPKRIGFSCFLERVCCEEISLYSLPQLPQSPQHWPGLVELDWQLQPPLGQPMHLRPFFFWL